jgi:hypothetical protein
MIPIEIIKADYWYFGDDICLVTDTAFMPEIMLTF